MFFKSIAIVIGPTPPGTGVIADAIFDTDSKSTSPTSLYFFPIKNLQHDLCRHQLQLHLVLPCLMKSHSPFQLRQLKYPLALCNTINLLLRSVQLLRLHLPIPFLRQNICDWLANYITSSDYDNMFSARIYI